MQNFFTEKYKKRKKYLQFTFEVGGADVESDLTENNLSKTLKCR
jgi:hypothetical protein